MADYEWIFKVTECIDNARWLSAKKNPDRTLINYSHTEEEVKDFKAEYHILSHWLSYIMDRQMSFQQIWDKGGYIASDIAFEFLKYERDKKDKGNTYPLKNMIKNFFMLDKSASTTNKSDKDIHNSNKIKLRFKAKKQQCINEFGKAANKRFGGTENNVEYTFSSRFPNVDFLSIVATLYVLDEYGGLKEFLQTYSNTSNDNELMKTMLFAMHKMTYDGIKTVSTELLFENDKLKDDIFDEARSRAENIKNDINEKNNNKTKNLFYKEKLTAYEAYIGKKSNKHSQPDNNAAIFSSKRAICALRDYIKCDAFKDDFRELMGESFNTIENQLDQLELPGDVWNNNSKFRQCLFSDIEDETQNKYKYLNRLLRKIYNDNDKLKKLTAYPEQFDITFDFVPRMCEKENCDYCLYKNNNHKEFSKWCIDGKDQDKYCPVIMLYCGYNILCRDAKVKEACLEELSNKKNLMNVAWFNKLYDM